MVGEVDHYDEVIDEEIELDDYGGLNPNTREQPAPYVTAAVSADLERRDSEGYEIPIDDASPSVIHDPSNGPYSGLDEEDLEQSRVEEEKKEYARMRQVI